MAFDVENPGVLTEEAEPSVEERWALIKRVAASEQFSRSARLRDFLLYVGRQSLKEGCPEIHEQEIGAKVFGRPVSYDRSSDNIVRVNATELRKRIESYFEAAGPDEPLIFEIPRGGYKPVFRRRQAEPAEHRAPGREESAPEAPAAEAGTVLHEHSPSFARIGRLVWPVLCVLLAIACAVLVQQNVTMRKALHPWENQPALAAFWSGFLDTNRQTDLVLPDDSVSVMEDISGTPLSLSDYMSRTFIGQIQSSSMSADRKQDVNQVLNHNLVTFGAVRAAQALLGEIPPTYPRYLTLARYFTADEIKRDNVVLIGGRKAVPWDDLFDDQLNFVTDYDYRTGTQIVRNRNPKAGEQAVYSVPVNSTSLTGYAVIAYLPNPSRSGNVVILAGTDSDATGAAAAFLTSEDRMESLRAKLGVGRFPYFEALLRTSRLSGTYFDAELVAFRTYPSPH
ncbi:MAG: hypothetical protein ACLQG3_19330 [Terracidiphilus sp.]